MILGHSLVGGTSNGWAPHERHDVAVRSNCQVGKTPLTCAAAR